MQLSSHFAPAVPPPLDPAHQDQDVETQAYDLNLRLLAAIRSPDVETLTDILKGCSPKVLAELTKYELLHVLAETELDKDAATDLTKAMLAFFPEALRQTDDDGRTPLFVAVQKGLTPNVTALLEAGADATAKCNKGLTALFWAVWSRVVEVVEAILLKLGMTVSKPPSGDEPPLVEQRDSYGYTSLMYAATFPDKNVANKLLEFGADINAKTSRGETLLIRASSMNDTNTVDWLLTHGAKVDLPDDTGRTALFIASSRYQLNIVRILLEGGANPAIKTPFGPSAENYALQNSEDAKQLAAMFKAYRWKRPVNP